MDTHMEVQTFDTAKLLGRRWFFRIVNTRNHEILAPSQPYKSKAQRDATATRFGYALACPVVAGKPR